MLIILFQSLTNYSSEPKLHATYCSQSNFTDYNSYRATTSKENFQWINRTEYFRLLFETFSGMALIHHRSCLFSDYSPSGILFYVNTGLFITSWAITEILIPCLLLLPYCFLCSKYLSPQQNPAHLKVTFLPEVSPNPLSQMNPSHSDDRALCLFKCQFRMQKTLPGRPDGSVG